MLLRANFKIQLNPSLKLGKERTSLFKMVLNTSASMTAILGGTEQQICHCTLEASGVSYYI